MEEEEEEEEKKEEEGKRRKKRGRGRINMDANFYTLSHHNEEPLPSPPPSPARKESIFCSHMR